MLSNGSIKALGDCESAVPSGLLDCVILWDTGAKCGLGHIEVKENISFFFFLSSGTLLV